MARRGFAILVLASCGGPPDPVVPERVVVPPPVVSDAGVIAVLDAGALASNAADAAPAPTLQVREGAPPSMPTPADAFAIAGMSHLVTCSSKDVVGLGPDGPGAIFKPVTLAAGESVAWCKSMCVIVASKKGNYRLSTSGDSRALLPIPPLPDPTTLSMSADCTVAAFRVPTGAPTELYEIWDAVRGKKLRASSSWPVAGGAFSAELVPSGRFLRWSHSRGAERYEEVSSGVKGPDIGLHSTMSPDDSLLFVGGGMTFGTSTDTPAELLRSKNGARVYGVPKPAQTELTGVFCPSGRILATIEPGAVVLRSTSDPRALASLKVHATALLWSLDGPGAHRVRRGREDRALLPARGPGDLRPVDLTSSRSTS